MGYKRRNLLRSIDQGVFEKLMSKLVRSIFSFLLYFLFLFHVCGQVSRCLLVCHCRLSGTLLTASSRRRALSPDVTTTWSSPRSLLQEVRCLSLAMSCYVMKYIMLAFLKKKITAHCPRAMIFFDLQRLIAEIV